MLGNLDAALADHSEAIRLAPTNDVYFAQRSEDHRAKKQYTQARADMTEAIRLDPADDGHLAARARIHMAMADYNNAIVDLTAAIGLDPSDSRHYAARAVAYMKARKAPRAYLDIQKALELRSDAPDLLELRGRVLQAMNARAGAIEAYRKALAGDARLTASRVALWRLRAGS